MPLTEEEIEEIAEEEAKKELGAREALVVDIMQPHLEVQG